MGVRPVVPQAAMPEGPEIAAGQRGGTPGKGQTPRGQLGEQLDPSALGALEGRRAWTTSGRRRVVSWHCWPWGSVGNRQHAPAAPLWGIRQGRFCAACCSAGAGGGGKHRQHAAPWCCWPRGIGSNVDVMPRSAAGRATRGALLAANRCRSRSTPIPRPVADLPPVVSPAASPGNGCWPGPVILAVKIGFRPPADAPPVKIGCRYAAGPVVLPSRQRPSQDDLVIGGQDQGRIGSQSFHASARRQCANGTAQKIRRANPWGSFL